jgi:LuxR family transcriptional regulator, maltose regulon positive regulatory protein
VLVASKLRPQPFRGGLLHRAALLERLSSAPAGGVTLLAAPAGFGKTTVLSEWRGVVDHTSPLAWLTLDPTDNDPALFWAYVLAALAGVLDDPARGELERVSPGRGDWLGDLVPTLINTVADAERPVVLVLDDYHAIADRSIHDALAFLAERLPGTLRLVLATRSDPPLPLARLRARGLLTELRAAELRFAADEARELLNDSLRLDLGNDAIAQLHERTEGWAAGLYLAGLSLQRSDDRAAFVDAFSGDDRHIVDYLGEEVLAAQTPDTRAFLLATSILTRLCGPLCDAVLGRDGSAEVLDRIEASNLFLEPLDTRRVWYRYHQLFAELLRQELGRSRPADVAELHRRASDWHAAHGTPAEAIQHALAATDVERACALVAEHWVPLFNTGQLATLGAWLDALPPDRVVADGRLCVARAWIALDLGAVDDAAPWVARAEAAGRSPETAVLRAVHHFKRGEVTAAEAAAREAVDGSAGDGLSRTAARCLVGITALWQGDAERARTELGEPLSLAAAGQNDLAAAYVTGYQATLLVQEGAFVEAEALARHARRRRDDAGFSSHFVLSIADSAYAAALLGQHRAEAAAEPAHRAVQLAEGGGSRIELAFAEAIAARVHAALGRADDAARLVERARARAEACEHAGLLTALVERAGLELRRRRAAVAAAGESLTAQELAVLRLLPDDLSLREIGQRLFVSLNTIKTHVRAIYRKLGATTRNEAVTRARAAGLLGDHEPAAGAIVDS